MRELKAENPSDFSNLMHMQPAMIREVLDRVGHLLTKQDTRFRAALEPGLQLAITKQHFADYKFLWVDVRENCATSGCSIFNNSRLKTALENGDMGFPEPDPLPADDCDMPHLTHSLMVDEALLSS